MIRSRSRFVEEFITCSKGTCRKCPHGPYWYEYWREDGKPKKRYWGKVKPERAHYQDDQPEVYIVEQILTEQTATLQLALVILGLDPSCTIDDARRSKKKLTDLPNNNRQFDYRMGLCAVAAFRYIKRLRGWD